MAALVPNIFLQVTKTPGIGIIASVQQVCNYSQKPKIIKDPTTASLKRGTGGRSSFNGIICTVFGASGVIGRNVVTHLGRMGTQIIVPYRGDFSDVRKLKIAGDLGQVLFHPFDLRDEDSIRKCIKYSNVVINCIGREWETRNFTYEDVNVEGAARLARICKEHGIERFIHLSHLNASPEPEPIILEGGSKFLKSKWKGELEVKREFPDATIIRPSDVYSNNSSFLKHYFTKWRLWQKGLPLAKNMGEDIEKQPVWVGDVGAGIIAVIKDRNSIGKTYQFPGAKRYKLLDFYWWGVELNEELAIPRKGYHIRDLHTSYAFQIKVSLIERLFLNGPKAYVHWEGLEKGHLSDKIDKSLPTLEDLGIEQADIEAQFPYELRVFATDRHFSRYSSARGEIFPPKPINIVT